MNPIIARCIVLAATIAIILIRLPHEARGRKVRVERRRSGALDIILLNVAGLAAIALLVWIFSPVFAFADYPSHLPPLIIGTACLAVGIWLFYRSHADLGKNWSATLTLREQHALVTRGIYGAVRHPMYVALLSFALGQALVVPNWIAGPPYLLTLILLFVSRIPREERMLLEKFGRDYENYMAATNRLIPGVW